MPLRSFRVGRCEETIEQPVWTLGHLPTPLFFGCVSQTTKYHNMHHTTLLRSTHRELVEIHRTAADVDDRAVSPGTHVREERVRHFDHAEKVDLKGSRHALEP